MSILSYILRPGLTLSLLLTQLSESLRQRAYIHSIRMQLGANADSLTFGKNLMVCGTDHITVGKGSYIADNCILTAWTDFNGVSFSPTICIGKGANIGSYNNISSINSITIGDNLLTGRWVTIIDHRHGTGMKEDFNVPPIVRPLYSKGPIRIGNNVWIGDKVTILPNVSIGNNVVIGANCVVTKDIPDDCVAVGNPIRIIIK